MKKTYTSSGRCIIEFDLPRAAAQDAHEVRLLGEFNDWSWEHGVRLSPDELGFRADVELPVGRDYQFRFLVDRHRWENQWDADAYVATPFGVDNSVVCLSGMDEHAPLVHQSSDATHAITAPPAAGAPHAVSTPHDVSTLHDASTPHAASEPEQATDDLTVVEGIGPAIARLLNGAGISTFTQLARADARSIRAVLGAAGPAFAMHDPTTWPEQAFLASRGDTRALAALQERLIAGRRPEDLAPKP